jgi:hypothetical protein
MPALGIPEDSAEAPIRRKFSLQEFLILGAWIGLLGGMAQVVMLAATRFGLGKIIHSGVNVVWAAPLSLAVLGVGLALPVAVLAGTRLGKRWPALPAGILCGLGIANVVLVLDGIHPWARFLLITGIAGRVALSISAHPDRWVRRARRSLPPLLAGLLLVAGGIHLGLRVRESRLIAGLPAPRPGVSDILLIVLDTERALDLSAYGYARRTTPTLERLARDGILFDRAYTTSSWSLSSHASMLTGRLPSELEMDWTAPLHPRHSTLAEQLVARGYLTGGFSANPFYVSRAAGLAQGFVHFEDRRLTPASVLLRSAVASWLTSPRFRGRLFDSYQFPGRKSARHLRNDGSRPFPPIALSSFSSTSSTLTSHTCLRPRSTPPLPDGRRHGPAAIRCSTFRDRSPRWT